MTAELGAAWRSRFASFDSTPFASASIGQVHCATLAPHVAPELPFRDVAVKVQFPNIKSSIHSDLKSLSMLLYTSRLLPRGLFLDKTLAAMEEELEDECDYIREADAAKKFQEGLEGDDRFTVMRVVDQLCTKNVLTMERLDGVPIIRVLELSQQKRDQVRLGTLDELPIVDDMN
jgi:aarF domain-containing kinase